MLSPKLGAALLLGPIGLWRRFLGLNLALLWRRRKQALDDCGSLNGNLAEPTLDLPLSG